MAPSIETNALPRPTAQIDTTVEVDLRPAGAGPASMGASVPSNLMSAWETILAAVFARAGEVESAEWALDQAKAACDEQIIAASSAGVPAEKIAAAAGVCASVVAELVRGLAPAEG